MCLQPEEYQDTRGQAQRNCHPGSACAQGHEQSSQLIPLRCALLQHQSQLPGSGHTSQGCVFRLGEQHNESEHPCVRE